MKKLGPKVSIIITCFKSTTIHNTLAKLLEKTWYDNYKVIIIDHDTYALEMVKHGMDSQKVHIISLPVEVGVAAKRNMGISIALKEGSDYIMIMDDDMLIDGSGWLAELIFCLESLPNTYSCVSPLIRQGSDIIGAGLMLYPIGTAFGLANSIEYERHKKHVALPNSQVLIRCNFLKEILRRGVSPYYSPMFFWSEDVDFGLKIYMVGYKALIHHDVVFTHLRSSERSLKQFYYGYRGRLMLLFINFSLPHVLLCVPIRILVDFLSIFKNELCGNGILLLLTSYFSFLKELRTHTLERTKRNRIKKSDWYKRVVLKRHIPFP